MEQRSSTETLNEVGDAAFIQTLNELERCRRRCNTHNARIFITLAASVYQRVELESKGGLELPLLAKCSYWNY